MVADEATDESMQQANDGLRNPETTRVQGDTKTNWRWQVEEDCSKKTRPPRQSQCRPVARQRAQRQRARSKLDRACASSRPACLARTAGFFGQPLVRFGPVPLSRPSSSLNCLKCTSSAMNQVHALPPPHNAIPATFIGAELIQRHGCDNAILHL